MCAVSSPPGTLENPSPPDVRRHSGAQQALGAQLREAASSGNRPSRSQPSARSPTGAVRRAEAQRQLSSVRHHRRPEPSAPAQSSRRTVRKLSSVRSSPCTSTPNVVLQVHHQFQREQRGHHAGVEQVGVGAPRLFGLRLAGTPAGSLAVGAPLRHLVDMLTTAPLRARRTRGRSCGRGGRRAPSPPAGRRGGNPRHRCARAAPAASPRRCPARSGRRWPADRCDARGTGEQRRRPPPAVAMPSSTIRAASLIIRCRMRLITNPGPSPTTIASGPARRAVRRR